MKSYEYEYDILNELSNTGKYNNYLTDLEDPDLEAHHFYVDENYYISTTCKHLHHIFGHTSGQSTTLIGSRATNLFEIEAQLKKYYRLASASTKGVSKEILLKRKDGSTFWALMLFRIENHVINKNNKQLLCQFVNINKFKEPLNGIIWELPKTFRLAFHQYLIFFKNYVKASKDKDISLDIVEIAEGLKISINPNNETDIITIVKWFYEYLSFIGKNLDDLTVEFTQQTTTRQADLLILELKQQVNNLRHALELSELRYLMQSDQVNYLQELTKAVITNKPSISNYISSPNQEFIKMGDTYNVKQAGSVGPNSQANNNTFQQVNHEVQTNIDFDDLLTELQVLKEKLKDSASSASDFAAISEVVKAEEAAKLKDSKSVIQHLGSAGKWVYEVAKGIGTDIISDIIQKQIGIS